MPKTLVKSFTLLELIVVIIIVGILATLGFTQYSSMIERSRQAEALSILTTIRQLQKAYYLEHGAYAAEIANLELSVPTGFTGCDSSHYFYYTVKLDAPGNRSEGIRCREGQGGKPPDWKGGLYCVVVWYNPEDYPPNGFQYNGCGGGGP